MAATAFERAVSYRNLVMQLFENNARTPEHILAYNESYEIVEIFEPTIKNEKRPTRCDSSVTSLSGIAGRGPL